MGVIHVPPPSREAFNKFRPMSDLIKSQVKHFKHLEEKFLRNNGCRFPNTGSRLKTMPLNTLQP